MKLKPYSENDMPRMVSLLNEVQRQSYEFIPYTEEGLRARLTGASSVLLTVDEQDRILGFAYLRQDWYGETFTLCVRFCPERDEISDRLLAAIEPANKTGDVSTSIDPLDSDRLAFFTARGYEPESSLYQMLADLEQPLPLPPLPDGYVARCLRPDEEEALIQLANAAYDGDRLRPGILERWRADDPIFDVDLVHLAEYGGELVALVAGRSDLEYNKHYRARRGYLGPACTLPAHRAKGLIKVLTARAMHSLRDRGMRTVCLHTWEGNPPAVKLTKDLGFRVGHEYRILHKILPRSGEPR
ncbi:MAG: GNAT family N-acetyltransferase [Dehalococcoidia bacterium]|nr:GNAT family N-acetyltransferase [Dehalococcoidia bacterium]